MNLDIKSWLLQNRGNATLLGICPIFEEIIRASLEVASEERFIPMFVATSRQVDAGMGYTGWSQEGLIEFIRSAAGELGYIGPYLVARDHGGPYQSERDRGKPEVSLEKAMGYAKETFARDLRSGFEILHVDATEDASRKGPLELEEVVRRTVELIAYIEDLRGREGLPKVYYEVGTEETAGGMTEPASFERFIRLLKSTLTRCGCERAIERLLFIVGRVGTVMRIDLTNQFNLQRAQTLVNIASRHNLFLKVHYTDWLKTRWLKQFPKIGIGAANVGPEFATTVITALDELERREIRAVRKAKRKIRPSNFMTVVEEETVEKAPLQKFARGLGNRELEEFSKSHGRR